MFDFSKVDWMKVGKGALMAASGAALTYLSSWASGQDFGALAPVIGAVLSVAVNLLHKLATTTPEANG
jgi:hypothetical protein